MPISTPNTKLGTIRPPWQKYNAHLLVFMWKMFILTDLTDVYVLESIFSWM